MIEFRNSNPTFRKLKLNDYFYWYNGTDIHEDYMRIYFLNKNEFGYAGQTKDLIMKRNDHNDDSNAIQYWPENFRLEADGCVVGFFAPTISDSKFIRHIAAVMESILVRFFEQQTQLKMLNYAFSEKERIATDEIVTAAEFVDYFLQYANFDE